MTEGREIVTRGRNSYSRAVAAPRENEGKSGRPARAADVRRRRSVRYRSLARSLL